LAASAFNRYRRKVWFYGVTATSAAVVSSIIILMIVYLS